MQSTMLAPVVVLAAWTHVMWGWMYATRIPAMRRLRIPLDPQAPRGEQMAKLPPRVRWKADNYNHLMEQPTVFFAVAISLFLLGANTGWPLVFAWVYVALRVVHSLVQALWNRIEVRFTLFALSGLALIGLTVRALQLILR